MTTSQIIQAILDPKQAEANMKNIDETIPQKQQEKTKISSPASNKAQHEEGNIIKKEDKLSKKQNTEDEGTAMPGQYDDNYDATNYKEQSSERNKEMNDYEEENIEELIYKYETEDSEEYSENQEDFYYETDYTSYESDTENDNFSYEFKEDAVDVPVFQNSEEYSEDGEHFVQLTNDYDDENYASDILNRRDESQKGSADKTYSEYHMHDFKEEAVEEPIFQRSESENSRIHLKSSMNMESAAQVSDIIYPVSSGETIGVGMTIWIISISLLSFIYTHFRLHL